jgi:hypothetical protein
LLPLPLRRVQSLAVDGVDHVDALAEEDGVVACATREVVFLSVLHVNFVLLPAAVGGVGLVPTQKSSPVPQSMVAAQATPAVNSTAKATETNNKTVLRIPLLGGAKRKVKTPRPAT